MNITEPIRESVRVRGGALAVIRPDGSAVTYAELDRTIDATARRLLGAGLARGETAAIATADWYLHLVLRLALARIGIPNGAPGLPAQLVDVRLVDRTPGASAAPAGGGAAPPSTVVTPARAASSGRARVVTIDDTWAIAPPGNDAVAPVESVHDDALPCGYFPSSGTTGTPKHVAIGHALMARRIEAKATALPLPPDPVQICTIGVGSYYGFSSVLRVLWVGGTAVLPGGGAPHGEYVARIERHRVNSFVTAPMTLGQIVAARAPRAGPLPSLELVEVGGAQMSTSLYEIARERFCASIVSSYGAVEIAGVASAGMASLAEHPDAVGYLHPGVEVQAVDEQDRPLPPGEPGLLRIRSALCAQAYAGDAETSARVFRNGWVYPGDVGSVSEQGLVTLGGRSTEVINSGGNKVNPTVVEDVLKSFPGVRDAAAFGVPDALGNAHVWAAIVSDAPVDAAALYALCRQRLGNKAPRHVLRLDALPHTDTGKVQRAELARMVLADHPEQAART
jgi:acyl-coenzyme A synthetase/AMP-(fatty) acid ligase